MKTAPQSPPPVETKTPAATDLPPAEPAATESDQLLKDLAEQKDLHLRLAADFENFKRRSRQESETRAAAQKEAFIHELLPVIDNLERALASGAAAGSKQLHQGVEMTLQQLQHLLAQHGIETRDIAGEAFDPHQHEAVSQGSDPAKPDHVILEVMQRGYHRGPKVIRPAKVVVNSLPAAKQGAHAR